VKSEVFKINVEADIINARVKVKALAEALGFDYIDQTRIATAVSELARNALEHAGGGELSVSPIATFKKRGLELTVTDHGPGIANLELALRGGFSTKRGLGFGLSGSKKLMDVFHVETEPGKGTVVTAKKWLPK
jgi:serine/threonine-protein kinase RsbT